MFAIVVTGVRVHERVHLLIFLQLSNSITFAFPASTGLLTRLTPRMRGGENSTFLSFLRPTALF